MASGPSKLDAQDAMLAGLADAQKGFDEFLQQWNLPSLIATIKPMWMQLTPEQKEKLKQANPQMYAQIEQAFAGGAK